jgi:hypothetical protein
VVAERGVAELVLVVVAALALAVVVAALVALAALRALVVEVLVTLVKSAMPKRRVVLVAQAGMEPT